MKKLMIVLIIIACGWNASAQSSIKVKLTDGSPINVSIDGRYFNKRGTSVTVGDLPPGRHRVQIYSVTRNQRGRGREDVIYEGRVKSEPGMVSILTYDPNSQRTDIQEQDMSSFDAARQAANNGNGYNQNNNNQGNNNNLQPAPAPVGTLTEAKIDQLKSEIAGKTTDTEKTNSLKDGLKNEKITTAQIEMMMDWFNFESSKVDFAEWAYDITVDKDAYPNLESKFIYKSYQDDLDKFIKTKQ